MSIPCDLKTPSDYPHLPTYNDDGSEKHVICDGARFHVLSWSSRQSVRCSESGCEVNRQQGQGDYD